MLRKLAILLLLAAVGLPTLAQVLGDHHVRGVYSSESPVYSVKARAYQTSGQPLPGLDDATCSLGYDDQPEIQAAVDAMVADAIPGSVLFFPPGIYCIAERIVIPALSDYKIMGDHATIVVDDLLNGASSGAAFKITSASNLEISGISIVDYDSATHSGAEQSQGIICDACQDLDIHDIYCEGMGDECIDIYDTVTGGTSSVVNNITIRNSHFKDCSEVDTAGSCVGIRKASNVQIRENFFEDTGTKHTGDAAVEVSCPATECADTILRDISITGNHFLDLPVTGILIGNADSIATGLVIKDNVLRNVKKNGIRVAGSSGGTSQRTQIVGNTLEDCGDTLANGTDGGGIYVSQNNSDGSGLISGNIIDTFGDAAVDTEFDNQFGIYVKSGGWVISDNVITTSVSAAIRSTTSGDPNLIEGNHIVTSSATGIYAVDADQVIGNYVSAAASCIYIDAGVKTGLVAGNSVDGCTSIGIRLNGVDIWAIGNSITDSAAGITPSGGSPPTTGPRQSNNVFSGNTADFGAGTFATSMRMGPTLDVGHTLNSLTDCAGSSTCTPDVSSGAMFRTANTGSTATITGFDCGGSNDCEAGQVIWVQFDDTGSGVFTIVDFTGTTMKGNSGSDWTPTNDQSMTCVFGGTDWYCTISAQTATGIDLAGTYSWTGTHTWAINGFTYSMGDYGATGTLAATTGATDEDDCAKFDINGMLVSSGVPCSQVNGWVVGTNTYATNTIADADTPVDWSLSLDGVLQIQSFNEIDSSVFAMDTLGNLTCNTVTTAPTATPSSTFKDVDMGATPDVSGSIVVNCPTGTTAGGDEDCDMAFNTQVAGTLTEAFRIDTTDGGTQTVTATAAIVASGGVTGALTGNASTATALAADPTDCAAGSYSRGIAADGDSSALCTDATTEIDSAIATHTALANSHHNPPPLCFYIETPVTDEEFYTIWRANQAITITEIFCEVEAATSVILDFEIDDGTVAAVNGSDITCVVSTGTTDSTLAGDVTMADGDKLDLDLGTVTGSVGALSVCIEYTVD